MIFWGPARVISDKRHVPKSSDREMVTREFPSGKLRQWQQSRELETKNSGLVNIILSPIWIQIVVNCLNFLAIQRLEGHMSHFIYNITQPHAQTSPGRPGNNVVSHVFIYGPLSTFSKIPTKRKDFCSISDSN